MKKKKIQIHSVLTILSFVFAACLIGGGVFASWAVTDNADRVGIKIGISGSFLEEGHYLYWNGAEVGEKITTKQDLPGGDYKYVINVSDTMIGNKTFMIKDQDDNIIINQSSALDIALDGTYTIETKNSGSSYDFLYSVYLSNNKNFTSPYAYIFNTEDDYNHTWPGVALTDTGEKNEHNESIFRADIDAKRFAKSTSKIILSDNGSNQTVDISLGDATPGSTGYFISSSTQLEVKTSNVSWWDSDDIVTCAWFFNSGQDGGVWYKMTNPSAGVFKLSLDSSPNYNNVLFARCQASSVTTDTGNSFPPGKYNQTVDLNYYQGKDIVYEFTGYGGDNDKAANINSAKYLVGTYERS